MAWSIVGVVRSEPCCVRIDSKSLPFIVICWRRVLGVRSVLFISAVGEGLETVNMMQFKDMNMRRRKKNEVDWVSNFICTSEESVCLWTKLIAEMFFRNYMNDSLRTNVFVRFQPETIACACIYLAARALQVM